MHLLITYDLKAPGKDYAPLINMIKTIGSGTWAHIQDSVWYVKTSLTPDEVVRRLRICTDVNDILFVAEISRSASRNLPHQVQSHLSQMRLP